MIHDVRNILMNHDKMLLNFLVYQLFICQNNRILLSKFVFLLLNDLYK